MHVGQKAAETGGAVLCRRVAETVPFMQARAIVHDQHAVFPHSDISALREFGALYAPLPLSLGGFGFGTEPAAALNLMDLLRVMGRGNLSLGRLYEAHVNAIRLVVRYGTQSQIRRMADDAQHGHLFGLWVTDDGNTPLLLRDGCLFGTKAPCSGAGQATRAVVTARLASGEMNMLFVPVDRHCHASRSAWNTQGMRGTANGSVTFDGLPVDEADLIGAPGDYLRQPDFSTGAWRTSAVTLGGLESLVLAFCNQLTNRKRQHDTHQRTRVGRALIAQETARMWVQRAALAAETNEASPAYAVNIVNLARIAVETSCLEALELVQRGIGMSAFQCGQPIELLSRDLMMYLRQPAPDETLCDAAAHFMDQDLAVAR